MLADKKYNLRTINKRTEGNLTYKIQQALMVHDDY